MTLQKYDLAIKDYAAAIKLAPKKSSIYQQSAVAWKLSGELARAISEFTKAIDLDSKNIPALMGRGFVWFQLEKSERAIADFSKVIELNPLVAEAYNNRAYNHQLLGDYAEALVDYDRTLKIDPNHRLALQNKAWLLSAAEDEAIRNGTEAIVLAKKACELSQFKDVGDLRALAAAFAEDQQYEKAIGWQEKVVEQVPAAAQVLEKRVLERYRSKRPFRIADVTEF
jgi:tetratricopeptide (TPR) repeat protein